MVDPVTALAIAGNIVQFLETAYKLAGRIKNYCDKSSHAPPVFRELAVQIPMLCYLFEDCRSLKAENVAESANLVAVLDGCRRVIESLDRLLASVLPENDDAISTKVWKGFKSVSVESKVLDCKTELESYKSTLSLHLSLLTAKQTSIAVSQALMPCFYHVPAAGRARFIGREDILQTISQSLTPGGRDYRIAVLLGMGGQGKTSLALEYCRREMANRHFKFIIWIDSSSPAALERSFAQAAENLAARSGDRREFANSKAHINFVKAIIENNEAPWLFILDNFDNPGLFKNVLDVTPHSAYGAVLFTSRHSGCASLGTPIAIPGMSEADSTELLLQRSGHNHTITNLEQAKRVVDLLGHLPLAIDQSAAYIRSRRISPGEFISHYQKRREKVLKHVPNVWDYPRSLSSGDEETPVSVFGTWELSLQQALDQSQDEKATVEFLTIAAFFNNADVRMEMFRAACEQSETPLSWMSLFAADGEWDEFDYQDTVAALADLSLVQYRTSPGITGEDEREEGISACSFSLHPLVQDWIQLRIPETERRLYVSQARDILRHYITSAGSDYQKWTLKERRSAMSHVDAWVRAQSKYVKTWTHEEFGSVRDSLVILYQFYVDDGRYAEAETICKQILAYDKKIEGESSQEFVDSEIRLAKIYLLRTEFKEAEGILTRLRPVIDRYSTETNITLLKNLAKVYFKQGRFEEAVAHYQDVLNRQERFLSEDDLEVLDTRHHLAQAYRNQGRHTEAIDLYTKVLASYHVALLDDHLGALQCMIDLAGGYRALAQFSRAAGYYDKAIAGVSTRLSPDHHIALSARMVRAINLRELGLNEDAEDAFRDIVERFGRILGPFHQDTLRAIMNFGILYDRTGRPERAEELYRAALAGREKLMGVDNLYTLRTVERLVSLLWSQGRWEEAETLTLRVLRAQRKSSLEDDMRALDIGKDDGDETRPYWPVEVLFTRAVDRDNKLLGEGHTDRIESQRSLVAVYIKQGFAARAADLQTLVDRGMEAAGKKVEPAPPPRRKLSEAPPPYSATEENSIPSQVQAPIC
jgi:tetratricopeptide (TPR) repeat protein